MTEPKRRHADDLRGASRLVVEATQGVTGVVEAMHRAIASGPLVLGRPFAAPARLVTRAAYAPVRGVTALVGAGLEAALTGAGPLLGEGVPGPEREALVAALNGVIGDHLEATKNPLAIAMGLRHEGRRLALDAVSLGERFAGAGARLVVLIHGSSMNDAQWRRRGHDHGAALARDLGYTALYARYNTGRPIAANGGELADLLERLALAWPTRIEELCLVGHSMGGLVARGACEYGARAGHVWRGALRKAIFLGSPHHGAALERGGNWLETLLGLHPYVAPLARLGRLRSAGVTDLRYGAVVDEHRPGVDRFARGPDARTTLPLPADVACYALAATLSGEGDRVRRGDGLVTVDSALGRHADPSRHLAFDEANLFVAYRAGHLDLLDRADVYARLRDWLAE